MKTLNQIKRSLQNPFALADKTLLTLLIFFFAIAGYKEVRSSTTGTKIHSYQAGTVSPVTQEACNRLCNHVDQCLLTSFGPQYLMRRDLLRGSCPRGCIQHFDNLRTCIPDKKNALAVRGSKAPCIQTFNCMKSQLSGEFKAFVSPEASDNP